MILVVQRPVTGQLVEKQSAATNRPVLNAQGAVARGFATIGMCLGRGPSGERQNPAEGPAYKGLPVSHASNAAL